VDLPACMHKRTAAQRVNGVQINAHWLLTDSPEVP
jgi:hypothetical protein